MIGVGVSRTNPFLGCRRPDRDCSPAAVADAGPELWGCNQIAPPPERWWPCVGARVRRRRLALGLNVSEVCRALRMDRGNYRRLEREGARTLDTLRRVAEALNCTVGALVDP